jgi:hypothetical protein
VDRLRTVASVIADNEQRTGGTDFKPAAPHPLESGGVRTDAPTDEQPSGGEPVS